MSFAFYIYTTIIMGVALVTSAVALVVWLMTRRRDSLVAAAGFLLYMLDMSVIFFDEYNRLKYDYAVTFSEPLQHPLLRCVLGIAIYACVVLWMFARLRKRPTSRMLGLAIVPFSILQLLLVPRSGAAGEVQQYLFWLTRDLGNVGCLAYAAWHHRYRATRVEKLDLDRSKLFWKVAFVLVFCVIAEDTYMILFCRPDSQTPSSASFCGICPSAISPKTCCSWCARLSFFASLAISCVCMPVVRVPMRTWQPRAQALRTISHRVW